MDKADEIISHNGKRFDTPWIRTRALKHDIPMRHTYNEIDTYKMCKKYLNLPSNSFILWRWRYSFIRSCI